MRSNWLSRFAILPLMLAAVLTGACSPYVNIPAQSGDVARNNANESHVQRTIVAALDAVLENRPEQGQVYLVLPEGSELQTYEFIRSRFGDKLAWSAGHPAPPAPDNMVIFDVRQIRIRGWKGQVDIVRPIESGNPGGPKQLVTVDLDYDPVNRWRSVQVREWRTDVDQALRESAASVED